MADEDKLNANFDSAKVNLDACSQIAGDYVFLLIGSIICSWEQYGYGEGFCCQLFSRDR